MKTLMFHLAVLFSLTAVPAFAQPVGSADAAALIDGLPAPVASLSEAFQKAYAGNASSPDAKKNYQPVFDKIEKAALENQQCQMQFYQKNPMGMRPVAAQPSRASAEQQSAMNAATSELAQKMLTDPAFAQRFSSMSEQEQHSYIAKLMAEKGIKPATGTPNVNTSPVPGMDVEWAEICTNYMQSATALNHFQEQMDLQQRYEAKHQEIRDWTEASIKKLPMYSYGEYGHDHDPEQVKAVQKEAMTKHRDVAEAMLKELKPLFVTLRQEARQRITPLNDALKKVDFGKNYDFGIQYTTVVGAQSLMFQEAHRLLTNEANMMDEVAKWEYEYRKF